MMIKLILPGLVLLFSCYTNESYCKNDQNGNNSMNSVGKCGEISAKCLNKPLPVFHNSNFDGVQDHKYLANKPFEPDDYKIITSDRADGRYVSTRGFVQYLIRNQQPQLAFDPQFSKQEFLEWQKKVREKMQELMKFPDVTPQPLPKFLSSVKREGYRVEKWEFYPQPGSVVPFLMLIPDGVSAENPAPVALCLPGSNHSKEQLAGEEELDPVFANSKFNDENKMAKFYAQEGIIAVAVDNPGIAETSDLEKYTGKIIYDRTTFTRYLIDMDWHYMGFSAFQSHQLLKWLRTLGLIDPERIVLSGHSLGTVAAMYLAVLNQDVYAVVYNQCITRLIDYAKVRTRPDSIGRRPESSWLGHSVPGMWKWFDYPDILASLSPRRVIFSEGATLSDIDLIKRAYHIMGADANLTVYHYPMYKDYRNRKHDYETIPEGLDHKEFWEYYNIDGPNHYFKADVVVPWLKDVLKP